MRIRTLASSAIIATALLVAAPAGMALADTHYDVDPGANVQHDDSWEIQSDDQAPAQKAGGAKTLAWNVDVCHGQFPAPDLSSAGEVEFGAYQNCTEETAQQVSVRVYKCTKTGTGRDDFDCKYKAARAGGIQVVFAYRNNVPVACNKSKSAYYQVEAYYIMADYVEHDPVLGNVQTVKCG